MKYIISEEELIDYTSKVMEDSGKSLIGTLYKDFLKSKQPVELVTNFTGDQFEFISFHKESGKNFDYVETKLYPKEINIKIYIQEVKEEK